MAHRGVRLVLSLSAVLLVGAVHSARADDWPQFRRDAWRTAASRDKLEFPLTELWTWSTRGPRGHTPLYHSVVWRNKVFFTASQDRQRFLISADAKTGKVLWRQPLETETLKFPISDIAGPAVTESGMVYVYDWTGSQQKYQSAVHAGGASFVVRSYRALDGQPLDAFPLVAMGANGVLPRLSLMEGLVGQDVRPVPPTFVGCPP